MSLPLPTQTIAQILKSITLTDPIAIVPNISTVDVKCFGCHCSATANPINGANPFYLFMVNRLCPNTTATEGGLVKGNYNVTITDNNGCFIVEPFSIDQPLAALSVTLNKTDVDCFGSSTGSITTVVNGGTSVPNYSFLWNNGSTAQNRNNL